jgi:AcrR family transcriptional regulator
MRKVIPKKHEEHRNRILAAARKLFASRGVKETSMSEVAKACRVTKAALYHYFKGKGEILNALFDQTFAEQDRFVQSIKREGTLESTILSIARGHLKMISSPQVLEMMKIFQSEGMKNLTACQRHNERIKESMDSYLRIGIERGILPDVDRTLLKNVVFTFFGALEHYFIHSQILKCDFVGGGVDAYAKFLASTFGHALEMIGAPPDDTTGSLPNRSRRGPSMVYRWKMETRKKP